MNVFDYADKLREEGYEVFTWRPKKDSVEPEIVANKNGRIFNFYLRDVSDKIEAVEAYARENNATVKYAV